MPYYAGVPTTDGRISSLPALAVSHDPSSIFKRSSYSLLFPAFPSVVSPSLTLIFPFTSSSHWISDGVSSVSAIIESASDTAFFTEKYALSSADFGIGLPCSDSSDHLSPYVRVKSKKTRSASYTFRLAIHILYHSTLSCSSASLSATTRLPMI